MSWFQYSTSRIHYEVSGQGDPVLLLPGFTDRIESHAALITALSPRYRVIAADLPGSGQSLPQPRNYTVSYYDDDARAFAALLATLGAKPAHLLGFSDGGEVALLMAATVPRAARSVLTWGAAGVASDPDGQIRGLFRNVIDSPTPPLEGYRRYLVDTYGESVARASTQSFASAIDAIISAGGDISRHLADRIACPAFLLVGASDFFVTKAQIDALASQIPRAETLEVADAGHGVHEDRPEWLVQTVADWLARH